MRFAEVAVPVPLRQAFTYSCDTLPEAGCRVSVPFGPRTLTGVVLGEAETPENSGKIKPVHHVIDDRPVLDSVMLKLCHWLSQ